MPIIDQHDEFPIQDEAGRELIARGSRDIGE